MHTVQPWLIWFGSALAAVAMVYAVISYHALRVPFRLSESTLRNAPPVTMLKPLSGAEPETYEWLRSFCDQSYPEFQVVFGVSDSDDAAVTIVKRLQRELP